MPAIGRRPQALKKPGNRYTFNTAEITAKLGSSITGSKKANLSKLRVRK